MSPEVNTTPQSADQLVEEFKKSGEFDRLRRQLLAHFTHSENALNPLMTRIEDISRDKLASDKRLEIKVKEAIHSELMQEIEKYPMIQTAVSEFTTFKDEAFLSSIEKYIGNIARGEDNDSTKLWQANLKPSEERQATADAMEVELENGELQVVDEKPTKIQS